MLLLITLLIILLPLIALFSGMALTPVLFVLASVLLLVHPRAFFGAPKQIFLSHKILILALLLCALCPLLGGFWSITPRVSFVSALSFVALCMAGAVVFVRLPSHFCVPPRIGLYFSTSIAIACVLLLLEQLPHGGIIRAGFALADGDFYRFIDKNVTRGLCALVILVWPAVYGLYVFRLKPAAWGLVALVALPLLFMHSMSAKMGLMAGVAVFLLVQRFPIAVPKVLAISIPLVLACWPLVFLALDKPLFSAPGFYNSLPESSQHRVDIWRFTLERVAEKPWLGWGMDTSRVIPGGDALSPAGRVMLPLHPHNSVLHVLLEEGVAGFFLTLAALALALREWVRLPVENALARASFGALIAAYIVVGFTAFGIWQSWWIATLWIGLALCRWLQLTNEKRF